MSTINIADVRVNGGTQSRSSIDRGVVSDYAEAVRDGATFPPITVFFDGASYWLADGFHRYEAYSAAQVYDVPADIRQGTQRDAILFSVNVTTTRKLIDDGFLMEPKIYIAKSPDESEYGRNSFGEFSDEGAASAGIKIVGDVVAEWIAKTNEHFGGPAKTIVFSPTVEHGRELCAAFAAAGFNFQQISYLDKDDSERAEKIAEFRRPDSLIHGLVSCGVLTKGFDVPDVLVGISCKPYRKSLSSHIQEIGRIMRTHPDKTKALWLDHCGNFERFAVDMYDVWDNGAGELSSATKRDSVAREREVKNREPLKCAECGGGMRGNTCTACGWERPGRRQLQTAVRRDRLHAPGPRAHLRCCGPAGHRSGGVGRWLI